MINALKKLKKRQPFLVLNGDTFFPINLVQLEKSSVNHDQM